MPSRCLLARAQFNWHTSLVAFKRDCLLFLSLQTTAIWWRGRRRLRRIVKTFMAHELCQRYANMYSWVGRCGLCSILSSIFTSNLVVIYIQFNRWMSTRRAGASRIVFWESDKIVTLTSIVGLCDFNKGQSWPTAVTTRPVALTTNEFKNIDYKLQITNCKLQIANYKLQITN